MFYNLTKELEKRGILRSDPRLTPVTTILKNIFLERLDRSGEMTQGIVGRSRELDICKKLLPLQHVCAGWRGSRDAQRVTLTQRASRISSWTSPISKSIFWNFETINYTFFSSNLNLLKNSLSTGWSNLASFWSTRPSKEGWSSQTFTASRVTSATFSAGLPHGKHK